MLSSVINMEKYKTLNLMKESISRKILNYIHLSHFQS